MASALPRRWLPSSREMWLPEPWPKKKPIAWITAMSDTAEPTAATAEVSSRPTKNVSAML